MWPTVLDMSQDDCKRYLRRIELEAYANVVTALRAQGELSKEKRKILHDLSTTLKISMERHKAEVRRAVNDEKLATIADQLCGPNTSTEWAIEGRRLIPLLPRLVPQTAFTTLANNIATSTAAENAKLPAHSKNAKPIAHDIRSPLPEPSNAPESTKIFQQSGSSNSPTSVTASQTSSIPPEIEEFIGKIKKRRRSSSNESPMSPVLPLPKVKIPVTVNQHSVSRVTPPSQYPINMNKIKITPCRSNSADSPSLSQKVIIVSSSSQLGGTSCASILQRSLSVPIVKTVSSGGAPSHLRGPSMMVQAQGSPATAGIASSNLASLAAMASSAYTMGPKHKHTVAGAVPAKLRPRIITPLAPQPPARAVRATLQPAKPKYSFQMKDPSSIKMMAIGSSGAKILPKPAFSSASSPSMFVVSTTPTPALTAPPRVAPGASSPRVITVHTAGQPTALPAGTVAVPVKAVPSSTPGKTMIVAAPAKATTAAAPKLVTLVPPVKTVQKVHLSTASLPRLAGAKTNVIVVQKGSPSGYARGVTLAHGVKEAGRKVALNVPMRVQMPTLMVKRPVGTAPSQTTTQPTPALPPQSTTPHTSNILPLSVNQEQVNKTTALADIMQASGILMDETAGSEGVELEDEAQQYFQPTSIEAASNTSSEQIESAPKYSFEVQTKTPASAMRPDEARVVTLEEAIEMLGQSDNAETRAILSQAGIEVSDQQNFAETEPEETPVDHTVIDDLTNAAQQVVHEEDVVLAEVDESIGELDPQTGIYSLAIANEESSEGTSEKSDPTARMDIFSTALASADINLDAFQFVDENMDMTESSVDAAVYLQEEPSGSEELDLQQVAMKMDVCSEESKTFSEYLQPADSTDVDDKTAVMVEPSHMDTTDMYIEDFASQKM